MVTQLFKSCETWLHCVHGKALTFTTKPKLNCDFCCCHLSDLQITVIHCFPLTTIL